jgi:serine/threonine-protein kinase
MIAVKVATRADARGEQIFEGLDKKLGADGLDILYEMVSAHGGTKGADRAAEILRRPDVLERLSPPLTIALELRDAPCSKKADLFSRAAREGDERALLVLELLLPPQCKPKIGQCCFRNDPALEQALKTLRARRRSPP